MKTKLLKMTDRKFPTKRIAALVPHFLGTAPGQQIRIEMWEKYLKEAGWEIEFFPFENEGLNEILYESGNHLSKATHIIECYQRQLSRVWKKFSSDVILIHREASLIGPSFLERLAARQKIPIIYDIDDPVFLPYVSPTNGWLSLLKFSKKTHKLFKLSEQIIAVNKTIGDYAAKYNPNVSVIPNCVDMEQYTPGKRKELSNGENVRLVWSGSLSTMPNLMEIVEPLKRLQLEHEQPLLVIGQGEANLKGVRVEMRQWSAATSVRDLQDGDIGLLPLLDLKWNHWKYFFKAVQYMAVGIPVVARRIGSNSEIIQDGVNGFLVETPDEWYDRLKLLVTNHELRLKMGNAARQTAVEKFSLQKQMPQMVEIFENVRQKNLQARN